jgi:hypothetical protein
LRRALDELDGVHLNEVFADAEMIWKFNPPIMGTINKNCEKIIVCHFDREGA